MTQVTGRPPLESARTADPLDVRLHAPVPDVVVVRVVGALDGTSVSLLSERVAQQYRRARHVVVDLGDVTFLGASGLSVLRDLHRRACQAGVRLYLAAEHRAVCRPLHLAGLDQEPVLGPSADLILARLLCRRSTKARAGFRAREARPRPSGRTQLEMLLSDAVDDRTAERLPARRALTL
jgi:anti-anti-sigma factor